MSPEEFSLFLCDHFIEKYEQVNFILIEMWYEYVAISQLLKKVKSCSIWGEQAPWERVKHEGLEHGHVFISRPCTKRMCSVYKLRGGKHDFLHVFQFLEHG